MQLLNLSMVFSSNWFCCCIKSGVSEVSGTQVSSEGISSSSKGLMELERRLKENEKMRRAKKAEIVNNDVDRYLGDPIEGDGEGFDLLNWWKVNGVCKYPILARIANDILAIPVSTIASESSFSTSGRIFDLYRSSLSFRMVEALICTQNWLRSENVYLHHVPTIEEMELCEETERELLKMPCGAAMGGSRSGMLPPKLKTSTFRA